MLRRSKWTILPMVARWDALLVAAAVAGGSMLIENSHRLDTGAPDEEVVAISTCSDTLAGDRDAWKPLTLPTGDESYDADAPQAPSACASE
jgi:hypothetical protein